MTLHNTPRHHMRKSELIIASSKHHKMRNCVIPRQRATNHNHGVRKVHDVRVLNFDPVGWLCWTQYLGLSGYFALRLGLELPGREAGAHHGFGTSQLHWRWQLRGESGTLHRRPHRAPTSVTQRAHKRHTNTTLQSTHKTNQRHSAHESTARRTTPALLVDFTCSAVRNWRPAQHTRQYYLHQSRTRAATLAIIQPTTAADGRFTGDFAASLQTCKLCTL